MFTVLYHGPRRPSIFPKNFSLSLTLTFSYIIFKGYAALVRDAWFTRVYSIGGHSYAKIRPWNRLGRTRKRIPSPSLPPPVVARFTRDAESAGRPCCTCNVISRGVSSTPLLLYRRVSGSFNKISLSLSLPSRLGRDPPSSDPAACDSRPGVNNISPVASVPSGQKFLPA